MGNDNLKLEKMTEDNSVFYYRHGDLSYDFDEEHKDHELADIEFSLIKSHLSQTSNSLQLFCGAGRHVLAFSRHNIYSIGIDISRHLIHKANELIQKKNCITGKVLCGDVLNLPFQENAFQCITALGNSICLLNDEQLEKLFTQTKRVMKQNGIFILDMPDFNFLIKQKGLKFNSSSRTKKFVSKKFGPGLFTWDRSHDPEKKMIFSNEQIIFHQGTDREKKYETSFFFNTLYPHEVEAKADTFQMKLIETIPYEDQRGIYKGMLKKRIFMVFQAWS